MAAALTSTLVSLSAFRSDVAIALLYVPSAATLVVKVLSLTKKVIRSPAVNAPVTLPCSVVLALPPSASVMMLSPVTGSRLMATLLSGGVTALLKSLVPEAVPGLPAPSVNATDTSYFVSGSAMSSAVGTLTLKLPCASTVPV